MRIALFTSNQPRHLALAERLAGIADEVFVVHECNTVFPGLVADFFKKSKVMQDYFGYVMAAEVEVFGKVRFLPANVHQLAIRSGDINMLELSILEPALTADIIIVFGASYIQDALIDRLTSRRAVNIHMGVSPYYRGSSCNFWAVYDGRPDLVGATIHLLGRGLDSGDMLFHALPKAEKISPFVFGMKAVLAAHKSLEQRIADGSIFDIEPVQQDKNEEIRYTRNADFDDDTASRYLDSMPTPDDILRGAEKRNLADLLRPVVI